MVFILPLKITSNTNERVMLDSFLTFINQFNPSFRQKATILTVSGGIDSMVMMDLFYKAELPVVVAHCNFGLRGQDSVLDEEFVREQSARYNFDFYVKHFETKKYSKSQGVSTQMAARDLRYAWFETLRVSLGLSWIATGHHLNDSLETSLINFSRGSHLAGLAGVPVRNGNIVRPLLFADRHQVFRYLEDNNLEWREDSSNSSLDYSRNRIRHQVVPVLKALNPSLEQSFQLTQTRLVSAERLLNSFLDTWKSNHVKQQGDALSIAFNDLEKVVEPIYLLWYLLKDYGFQYKQIHDIYQSRLGISGKIFITSEYTLLVDREYFVVKKKLSERFVSSIEIEEGTRESSFSGGELIFTKLSGEDNALVPNPLHAYLDYSQLVFPLRIRKPVKGDRIKPIGMQGKSKKISDILIDLKLSLFEKESVFILENGNHEIIWVIGIRLGDPFKLTERTQQILKVEFLAISRS